MCGVHESTQRVNYIERGNITRKGEVQVQVQVPTLARRASSPHTWHRGHALLAERRPAGTTPAAHA